MGKKFLHSEVIFGILTLLFSIFFFRVARTFPEPIGTEPGPAFFPVVLSVILFILSIGLIISGIKKDDRHFELTENIRGNLGTFGLTILVTAGFLILWRFVPFYICGFIYLFLLNLIFKQGFLNSLIFSLVLTGLTYYVFSELFLVNLNI